MTQNMIRILSDEELTQVIVWARDEQTVRAEKLRQDTINKIKELAGIAGVSVRIDGKRGRPPKRVRVLHDKSQKSSSRRLSNIPS